MNPELWQSHSGTICALATATGGALGIIRISGPETLSIVGGLCSSIKADTPANTIHFARITDGTEVVDEALVSIFRAPHSYTGEDAAEISCHGSSYILNRVLELLIQKGCRMAQPGEFTQRAFLNGKMDLAQAEAVADLIAARNRATHEIAMNQLRGGISSELAKLRDQLLHLTTLLELELDFSDHDDLTFADSTELTNLAHTIDNHIAQLVGSFKSGQALKQGIPVAIVGKTNVGKSTLLNQLIDDNRAIVSDIHGTTRDTIEEVMDINGVAFRFIDTAGLRNTQDKVEQIGIDRTLQKVKQASIVIWLLDAPPTEEESNEMRELLKGKHYLYVQNKMDKLDMPSFQPYIQPLILISAKTGQGIPQLKRHIYEEAQRAGFVANTKDVIISNARHYESLRRAQSGLARVIDGLNASIPTDLLAEDLRLVLSDLAEVTGGSITSQETLNNIFSHFCVGK